MAAEFKFIYASGKIGKLVVSERFLDAAQKTFGAGRYFRKSSSQSRRIVRKQA